MKQIIKNVLVFGIFFFVMATIVVSTVSSINRNRKNSGLVNVTVTSDESPDEVRRKIDAEKTKGREVILHTLPSLEERAEKSGKVVSELVNRVINAWLSSEPQSIPEGTKLLESKVEVKISGEEEAIILNFSKEFISKGEDSVYDKSIPAIIYVIEKELSYVQNVEYVFLIEDEPLEKALQRRYKE